MQPPEPAALAQDVQGHLTLHRRQLWRERGPLSVCKLPGLGRAYMWEEWVTGGGGGHNGGIIPFSLGR